MSNFLLLVVLVAACIVAVFQLRLKVQRNLPIAWEKLAPFFVAALRKQAIWLAIGAAGDWYFATFVIGFLALALSVPPWMVFQPKPPPPPGPETAAANNAAWLASLGATPLDRSRSLEKIFEEKNRIIVASQYDRWGVRSPLPHVPEAKHAINFTVARSLAAMDFREREALRFAEHFNSLANGKGNVLPPDDLYARWCTALVWGDGKGMQQGDLYFEGLKGENPIADYMGRQGLRVDQVINAIAMQAQQLKDDARQPELARNLATSICEAFGQSG